MSWRVTLDCSKAEAEAVSVDGDALFALHDSPPVLVAEEPDANQPEEWRLHAYFDHEPTTQELVLLKRLAAHGEPEVEHLPDTTDWVSISQAGLDPIRTGRFFVHTPLHFRDRPDDTINFEIDAGLAFGTGQHDTTAGCLAALDRLETSGRRFANIADIGTGTGLLAFAALALWPEAKGIATDIDPVAVAVSEENAQINGVTIGHGAGELLLATADGMDHPMLQARAPFDLLIANILAGPLQELAPGFAAALAPGGVVVLAGLLDTQADAVIGAYQAQGLTLLEGGDGEWRVLVLEKPA
ncbi:50S ribosomal protein L11 methyltransferase [Sphingomicrobium nitratireducens]|uniref:50S ribosomal protein L11 methyltransferase n=1 Tax=Sphingomicrobium nitratireducens TaxID=2964666 RepID=UPI00223EBF90|nr:50S ribosomal protein L11 methyltransferase [Sphingomicrobium nitratireducens]